MPTPARGLHETLLTRALEAGLRDLESALIPERRDLHSAEAGDRLALHVGALLRRALADVDDRKRVEVGTRLARALVEQIGAALDDTERADDLPLEPARILRAILALRPDGTPEEIPAPLIPLLDTTLLTNAPGEPRVGKQLETEIHSADRIDVVMAFIRRSGMRPLLEALRQHTGAGRALRILTTTYTGSTEAAALDQLRDLGAEVRVSYDTTSTRLHAKAWLFHRASGFSTAYVGSSNLTHSAQHSGLEWNVRVSGARNRDVIDKVAAVFESYWEGGEFEPYDRKTFLERTKPIHRGPDLVISPIELRPYPYQERLLEQLTLSRSQAHHRNLLVSATGTGKTVMAAVDYARLRERLPRARLLFVAHRKEILQQSRSTFRHALRDPAFGELWVGGERPDRFEHVFASIQSLNAAGLAALAPDHFDVVVVDEFHHAAAPSYAALLDHVQPRELLGMTATPERSDDLDILHWFDGRIAAELRLWDAIDQHRLTPFLYFGIHDEVDLSEVPWKRGHYDVDALTGVYTSSERWARLVLHQLAEHVDDVSRVRALGFCVSVEHARFMARVFQAAGVAATAVWGNSPPDERKQALRDLAARKIQVLFSVDLFNEGVDLPTVDTLLLLRPTDSPTLFLQQLGRGLRRAEGKTACTVLDFVGQHRREYRMDRRMGALLGGTRKQLVEQVEAGFPFLPAGCHMELDPVASRVVLANIKAAVPTRFREKATELARLAGTTATGDVSLVEYMDECGMELEDVYDASDRGWSDLRVEAGLPVARSGPAERGLRRATSRLLHIDDSLRIETYRRLLTHATPPPSASLPEAERRLLRMLAGSVVEKSVKKDDDLDTGARLLWEHPQVRAELLELLTALQPRISHVQIPLEQPRDVPLRIHACYTRREILAAFGVGEGARITPWQAGVWWAEEAQTDLFTFTLDKTSGQFSPTTRYRDYAINRELIHWESQSWTREDSNTGQRYQHHVERGSHVMLFARLDTSAKAFWFLGPARYVSHRSERPMAVTWRLEHALPGDLFAAFAAAVA